MHWTKFWRRRTTDREHRPPTPGQKDATSALSRAKDARREAEDNRVEVSEIAASLLRRRQKNRFAELIRIALEGDR